uniref:Reverse transcriptase domain-containing protein n=1 Tax=Tanacetum cinerariifolium TaxID=118510 RepID=A0A6L2N536_TANCI|nr:reverse transcriptase domain-containing protein [Tanacetum cinerariifolium]
MPSVISHWMVAKVMAGVLDVDALDDKLGYPLMIISKDGYLTHLVPRGLVLLPVVVESDIGDCDNTRDGGKITGGGIGSYEHYKGIGAEVELLEPRIIREQRIATYKGYRGGGVGCLGVSARNKQQGGYVAKFRTKKCIEGIYHRKNVDFVYLLWEDVVYQVEHKDAKKSNEMYYPRFTKVIIHYFMTKDPSIPKRNKENWHYVRDDQMFTMIKLVSRHQNTKQFGVMFPVELTNEDIRNFEAYKEYYAIPSGATPPKTKASFRKTKNSSKTIITPLTAVDEVSYKKSLRQTHISQASRFGANEGTVDFVVVDFEPDPRVPLILGRCFLKTGRALIDVHKGELTLRIGNEAITYNLDQTSRYSANYDQMTANKIDVTDEACEEYFQEVLGFSDVTASGSPTPSDDPIVELKDLPPHLEYAFLEGDNKLPVIIAKELGDKEKAALIKVLKSQKRAITWKLSDIQGVKRRRVNGQDDDDDQDDKDQDNNNDDQDADNDGNGFVHPKLSIHEEESKDEECFDPIVQTSENLDDEDVHTTQEFEDTPVTLTSTATTLPPLTIPTISQEPQAPTPPTTALSTFLQDLPNFGSLFVFEHRLKTLEANFSEFMQTNQFAGAVSSILKIVERYMDQRINKAIKVVVQIQFDRLRDEAQAENEDFLNNLDENIQKITKEQVKEQVKIILDTYGDIVTLKRRHDDADKDEETLVGSDHGSKRQREGKEPESTSPPKEPSTKTTGKSTQGSKSHQRNASESAPAEEPMQTTHDIEEPSHQEFETSVANGQPITEASQHPECDLAKQADSRSSFNELMDTPVDFSAFLMNRLRVDTLTPELLAVNRESARDVYSKRRIITFIELQIIEWKVDKSHGRRTLCFQRLSKNVPKKHHHPTTCRRSSTRCQKWDTYHFDLKRKEAYTAYSNPRGFIYQNKDKHNRLMQIDELHKFSDGMLNDVELLWMIV